MSGYWNNYCRLQEPCDVRDRAAHGQEPGDGGHFPQRAVGQAAAAGQGGDGGYAQAQAGGDQGAGAPVQRQARLLGHEVSFSFLFFCVLAALPATHQGWVKRHTLAWAAHLWRFRLRSRQAPALAPSKNHGSGNPVQKDGPVRNCKIYIWSV